MAPEITRRDWLKTGAGLVLAGCATSQKEAPRDGSGDVADLILKHGWIATLDANFRAPAAAAIAIGPAFSPRRIGAEI